VTEKRNQVYSLKFGI